MNKRNWSCIIKRRCFFRISKWQMLFSFLFFVILLFLLRYDAWFYNPPEACYITPSKQDRVLLSFGENTLKERVLSWRCDSMLTEASVFFVKKGSCDTLIVPAKGTLVFTRGGREAWYQASFSVEPDTSYFYQLKNKEKHSNWQMFSTSSMAASRFVYIGDVQDKAPWCCDRMIGRLSKELQGFHFWLFGGDLIERPTDAYWSQLFRYFGSLAMQTPIVSITGNHEYLKGAQKKLDCRWKHQFINPSNGPSWYKGRSYFLRFPNLLLVCIDTDGIQEGIGLFQQKEWLAGLLRNAKERWKIVVQHHPIRSLSRTRDNFLFRWAFEPIYKKYNVDLVLQGHDHGYKRNSPNKKKTPVYLISSLSPKYYDIEVNDTDDRLGTSLQLYQTIELKKDCLFVKAREASNHSLYDDFVILKGGNVVDRSQMIKASLLPCERTIKKGHEKRFLKQVERRCLRKKHVKS